MISFKVDADTCIQCGECANDCPYLIIEMGDDGYPYVKPEREAQCIRCQHCMAVCKPGALSILGLDPAKSRPLKGALPDAEAMETLIMGRRSTRRYKEEPLDPAVIARLLEATSHAPTGVNNRGVLMTVVEDPAVMSDLRIRTMDGIREAAQAGALPKRLEFLEGFVKVWDDKGVDVLFRRAPHLLVASAPADGPSPEADCHIALSYFELLAASMGLGTLWNGLVKWAMADIVPSLKGALGIPEEHKLVYAMVFGKPAVHYYRTVQRADANVNRVVALKD